MKDIILINKPIGLTPLEAILEYKKKHPKIKNTPTTYAGRLDPMAEGLLLVVSGDEIKNKKRYMALDKEYVAEILFGITSDTYDTLGIVREKNVLFPSRKEIENQLKKLVGKNILPLPPYSSYRVKGKPLFWWARKRKLKEIDIPKREMNMYSIRLISVCSVLGDKIRKKILKNINLVSGDFRQESAKRSWKRTRAKRYIVAKATIQCSSGTYIRSLAHEMGKSMKTGALLLSLTRTKIGRHSVKHATDTRIRQSQR